MANTNSILTVVEDVCSGKGMASNADKNGQTGNEGIHFCGLHAGVSQVKL